MSILVRDIHMHTKFLQNIFEMSVHQLSSDFAIMVYGDDIFQLHLDTTYAKHPLLGLLPENPPRGAVIEIRLCQSEPDECHLWALDHNATIHHAPQDKPYGLRDCAILYHLGMFRFHLGL
ncbi:MAG: glyoxalase [Paracoccaceae bacterium]|nr:glyoxalase [Paracoccaceae bacterium]